MAQYDIQREDFHGHARYVLRDLESNREASILPSVGNNCISYKIPKGDDLLELLYPPPDPDTLQGRASGYGTPILYPWPNRIDSGKFSFDGAEYQLQTPAPGEHASHGYVHERPWRRSRIRHLRKRVDNQRLHIRRLPGNRHTLSLPL